MAVLKTLDNSEMIISCKCGCDEGLRIKIEKEEEDYCYITYLSGNWYKEQGGFIKNKKILSTKAWKQALFSIGGKTYGNQRN